MKKTLFVLFLILCASGAHAQWSVGYSVGYGKYKMDDLKGIMSRLEGTYESTYPQLDLKLIDNFPGYVTHTLRAGYGVKAHEFGVTGSFMTTGAKLSYADYSGEIMSKLTVNAWRVGAWYRFYFSEAFGWNLGPVSLNAGLSPGALFSQLKSEEFIRIGNVTENNPDEIDIKATSFSLLPELGLRCHLLPWLSLNLNAGYEFCIATKVKKMGDSKIDWSGARVCAGVAFNF